MNYEQISAMMTEKSNCIISIVDPDTFEIYYMNPAALALFGLEKETFQGKKCYEVGRNTRCKECISGRKTDEEQEWSYYDEKNRRHYSVCEKWIEIDGKKYKAEFATDTTEQKKNLIEFQKKLEMEETLLSCIQLLSEGKDIHEAISRMLELIANYHQADRAYIFEFDLKENTMINTYGWFGDGKGKELKRIPVVSLQEIKGMLSSMKGIQTYKMCEVEAVLKGTALAQLLGELGGVEATMSAPLYMDGEIIGYLGIDNPAANLGDTILMKSVVSFIIADLNKRKLMDQLYQLSYTDNLTGLYNRHKYMEHMKDVEAAPPGKLGIIFGDINGLKIANDTYGHQYGDFLIKKAAEFLESLFGKQVYRIGGDEFVVFCADMERDVFDEKVLSLRRLLDGSEDLRMSIGASWGEEYIDVFHQVTHADELMYIDKQTYYGMRLDGLGNYHASLSSALLAEIEAGRFVVYLQPKIQLKTGEICGAEALVRRIEENGEITSPIKFISRYEAEGIIRHVDFFVLETVCAKLQRWKHIGLKPVCISVNFSRVTLVEYNITEKLQSVCSKYSINPEQIAIEVTESIGKIEQNELRDLIRKLDEAGFSISLDDFGTEYSNLAILASMDFNEVKLDKSLIDHLESNSKSRVIASHTIKMCEELGFTASVAEGIETVEQKSLLEGLNCDIGQGFYFDKPLHMDEFEERYMNGK